MQLDQPSSVRVAGRGQCDREFGQLVGPDTASVGGEILAIATGTYIGFAGLGLGHLRIIQPLPGRLVRLHTHAEWYHHGVAVRSSFV